MTFTADHFWNIHSKVLKARRFRCSTEEQWSSKERRFRKLSTCRNKLMRPPTNLSIIVLLALKQLALVQPWQLWPMEMMEMMAEMQEVMAALKVALMRASILAWVQKSANKFSTPWRMRSQMMSATSDSSDSFIRRSELCTLAFSSTMHHLRCWYSNTIWIASKGWRIYPDQILVKWSE